ncbi:DNA-binding transcription factor [Elasticomyces elasticus]|nr:DNA-binding transcription factor [Elasticomyces elasticus]KAK4980439.1 hypothetical protein LTR42_000746 [Elasticomyces elasticus]
MTTTDPTTQHTADDSTAYKDVISWCEGLVTAIDNVLYDHKDELRARDQTIYLDGIAFQLIDWHKHIVKAHESGKKLCLAEETVSLLHRLFDQEHVQVAAVMKNEPDTYLAMGGPLNAMFTTLNDIQELADVVVSTFPVLSPYNSDEEPSDYYSDEDPIADNGMAMRDMDTRLDADETPVASRSHRRAPSIPVAHSLHGHHHAGTPQNTTARDETYAAMAVNSASTSFDSAAHRVSTPDTHYSSDSNDLSQSDYVLKKTLPVRGPSQGGPHDRPVTFRCPICPKGFDRSHELGMHILAHENICDTFGQAYSR